MSYLSNIYHYLRKAKNTSNLFRYGRPRHLQQVLKVKSYENTFPSEAFLKMSLEIQAVLSMIMLCQE